MGYPTRCIALTLLSLVAGITPTWAESADSGGMGLDDMIRLDKPKAQGIQLTPAQPVSVSSLKAGLSENITMAGPDRKNMEMLWQALVQKNPVIQYSLKQLATPPELRYAQESIFSRTVGTLLTGASMVPYVFGADPYATGATSIGANMVDRAMHQSGKADVESLPSDTELVELSGTVQKLREDLITHYSDYVSSLRKAASLREQADVLTMKLQNAGGGTDATTQFTLKYLRDTLEQQSQESLESAKCDYLALERLVGVDTLKKLQLAEAQDDPTQDASQSEAKP